MSKIFATKLELNCKRMSHGHDRPFRIVLGLAATGAMMACSLAAAHAQSSLGIGTNEAMLPPTGPSPTS